MFSFNKEIMNFAESHIAKIIIIITIIIIKYCRKPNTERYKPATVWYRKHVPGINQLH
jgi:hypothetical protein